jgi:hypothetical protein
MAGADDYCECTVRSDNRAEEDRTIICGRRVRRLSCATRKRGASTVARL